MRDENCKKNKVCFTNFDFLVDFMVNLVVNVIFVKVTWPKTLKKWFNVKNKAQDFHADDFNHGGG